MSGSCCVLSLPSEMRYKEPKSRSKSSKDGRGVSSSASTLIVTEHMRGFACAGHLEHRNDQGCMSKMNWLRLWLKQTEQKHKKALASDKETMETFFAFKLLILVSTQQTPHSSAYHLQNITIETNTVR
eukprot:1139492-Pelagomonas_calceolata.AAC.5